MPVCRWDSYQAGSQASIEMNLILSLTARPMGEKASLSVPWRRCSTSTEDRDLHQEPLVCVKNLHAP